jgi:hypothetical protein
MDKSKKVSKRNYFRIKHFIWNYKVINIKAITVILKEVLNSSIN